MLSITALRACGMCSEHKGSVFPHVKQTCAFCLHVFSLLFQPQRWRRRLSSRYRSSFPSCLSSYSVPFLSTRHLLLLSSPSPIPSISSLCFGAQQHLAAIAMETVAQQQVGRHCCLGAWRPDHTLLLCYGSLRSVAPQPNL